MDEDVPPNVAKMVAYLEAKFKDCKKVPTYREFLAMMAEMSVDSVPLVTEGAERVITEIRASLLQEAARSDAPNFVLFACAETIGCLLAIVGGGDVGETAEATKDMQGRIMKWLLTTQQPGDVILHGQRGETGVH